MIDNNSAIVEFHGTYLDKNVLKRIVPLAPHDAYVRARLPASNIEVPRTHNASDSLVVRLSHKHRIFHCQTAFILTQQSSILHSRELIFSKDHVSTY